MVSPLSFGSGGRALHRRGRSDVFSRCACCLAGCQETCPSRRSPAVGTPSKRKPSRRGGKVRAGTLAQRAKNHLPRHGVSASAVLASASFSLLLYFGSLLRRQAQLSFHHSQSDFAGSPLHEWRWLVVRCRRPSRQPKFFSRRSRNSGSTCSRFAEAGSPMVP